MNKKTYKQVLKKGLILSVVFCAVFQACKKIKSPDLNPDLTLPIAHGIFGINTLSDDSIITEGLNGIAQLTFEESLAGFNLDSLLVAPDTAFVDSFAWGFGNNVFFQPGSELYNGTNTSKYNIGNSLLRKVRVKSGKIAFRLENAFNEKLKITYTLLNSTQNGQPVIIEKLVPAANGNNIGLLIDSLDLTDATIDLTSNYNTLGFEYLVEVDPNGDSVAFFNGQKVFINFGFVDIVPDYGVGYFGSLNEVLDETISIQALDEVEIENLALSETRVSLLVKNGIGADAQLNFTELVAINSNTNTQIPLVNGPLLTPININRGQENGLAGAGNVTESKYELNITESNSNINELFSVIPDSIKVKANFNVNPNGNISNGNDFIYLDYGLSIDLKIEVPLKLSLQQLTFTDTLDLSLDENTIQNLNKTGDLNLYLIANNSFPLWLNTEAVLLDENYAILDSLVPLNETKILPRESTEPKKSIVQYILKDDEKQALNNSTFIKIKLKTATASYPNVVDVNYKDNIDIQISLSGTYDL